jgi:6-phosphogluconolactonase
MVPVHATTVIYVGCAETSEIGVFRLDAASGELTPVETVTVPERRQHGPTTPLAVSPDKKFLYMAIRAAPFIVAAFAIDGASGKLDYIGNGSLADSMAYIATDRSGKFLLSASYGGHKISVNPIGPNGVPLAPQQTLTVPPNAHMIAADPANRFVLATSLGGDVVNFFRFDAASGRLAPGEPALTPVRAKSGPRHFVFHPNGKVVYVLGELDGSLSIFDYDAARGTLSARPQDATSVLPPGFAGKPWAADLHVTPNGQFLYGSERTSSTLAGFKVGPDGALTRIGSFATETQPRGFAIDPTGRYLFAVGQLSHRMTAYAIDPATGQLSALKQYQVGRNPNWIEVVTFD